MPPIAGSAFLSRFLQPAPFIGLDLAREKINMVQVDGRSAQLRVMAAVSDYHDSSYQELVQQPEKLQSLIKALLKKGGFSGRRVVATVPQPLLKNLFLNYQFRAAESESQAILAALKNRVPDDLSQYVIDYLAIKPQLADQAERSALVAMAKQDDVERYLDALSGCGLSVEALEIGPVALKRLVTMMTRAQSPEKVLTINFGTRQSFLTVIWQDQLLLDRKIDFGMEDILNAIAKGFDVNNQTALKVLHQYGLAQVERTASVMTDIDDEDFTSIKNVLSDILKPCFYKLADGIRDVLVYVASETRGGAIELIYLMGSLARVTAVDDMISGLISIPVKTINPFYGFYDDMSPSAPHADLGPLAGVAVATGLSMRGCI